MKKVVLRLVSFFLLILSSNVSGQDMSVDTLKIEEVRIVTSRLNYLSEVDKIQHVDS